MESGGALAAERVWIDKSLYQDAEKKYFENLSKLPNGNENNKMEITDIDGTQSSSKTDTHLSIQHSTTDTNSIVSRPDTDSEFSLLKKKKKKIKKRRPDLIICVNSDRDNNSDATSISVDAEDEKQKLTRIKKEKCNKLKQLNPIEKDTGGCPINNKKEFIESSSSGSIVSSSIVILNPDIIKSSIATTTAVAASATINNVVIAEKIDKPKRQKKKLMKNDAASLIENIENCDIETINESQPKFDTTNSLKDAKDKKNKKKIKEEDSIIKGPVGVGNGGECTLVSEIAKARQHIKNSLERMDGIAALASSPSKDFVERIVSLEKENESLNNVVGKLQKLVITAVDRINSLETQLALLTTNAQFPKAQEKVPVVGDAGGGGDDDDAGGVATVDDDDGVDLFASDSEDEDDAALREKRLAEYAARKSKKPTLIAKSNVILDVKPWDDETDMKEMENMVRKIEMDGLLWGASKLVPLAFGIHKLQISCVVEDEKVSIDLLTEEIEKMEDLVQSVDVAAFNKI